MNSRLLAADPDAAAPPPSAPPPLAPPPAPPPPAPAPSAPELCAAAEPEEAIDAEPDWLDELGSRAGRDGGPRPEAPPATAWQRAAERMRATPRAALALCAVGVLAVLVAVYAVFAGGDAPQRYPVVNFGAAGASAAPPASAPQSRAAGTGAAGAGEAASVAASPTSAAVLVVAVVGLVRAPGVHRLPPGSRIADALAAAGGAVRGGDTAALNLARPLTDGDQVVVGAIDASSGLTLRSAVIPAAGARAGASSAGAAAAGSASSGGTGGAVGGAVGGALVNINTGTAAELDTLPGVGPATAAAIIAHRERHGAFTAVGELDQVAGIGPATLATLTPLVTVG